MSSAFISELIMISENDPQEFNLIMTTMVDQIDCNYACRQSSLSQIRGLMWSYLVIEMFTHALV